MRDEQAAEKTALARREKIRVRVGNLRRSRQRSNVGFAEVLGLAGSALMLLAVVFVYLYFYTPAEARLAKAQLDRERARQQLSSLQKDIDVQGSTQDSIAKINESLVHFENDRLTGRDEGRLTLYGVLPQLIRSNNLRNTQGPVYNALEAKDAAGTSAGRTLSTRWQSLYPGIAVTVTVEGQYANVRHFVRDIEASSQFIIINAVELERAADSENSSSAASSPAAAPRNALVSLRLDMAAYFRRDVVAGAESVEQPASETR